MSHSVLCLSLIAAAAMTAQQPATTTPQQAATKQPTTQQTTAAAPQSNVGRRYMAQRTQCVPPAGVRLPASNQREPRWPRHSNTN